MSFAERIDALCRRRCSFALYTLPQESTEHFCLCEGEPESRLQGEGFVLATYEGRRLFIPAQFREPPPPERFEPLPPRRPREPETRREDYAALFRRYHGALGAGLHKVVLARTRDIPIAADFSPYATYRIPCATRPMGFKALVHTPELGTWICCTPEILLRGRGERWETMALAGTRPTSSTPWDAKNSGEQALVADFIRRCVQRRAEAVEELPRETLPGGDIEHLCTRFCMRMKRAAALQLLDELPPTPAVSGFPTAQARALIATCPDIERSCYAGYLGAWGDERVDLYVTLRCMQVFDRCCRLYAGGGLMPDSREEDEWRETLAKMRVMEEAMRAASRC